VRIVILDIHTVPILALGDYAANLLFPDSEGSILASLSEAIYLKLAPDEVIWIVTEGAPLHRRTIQLTGPLPAIPADTSYIVKNKRLALESGGLLDFTSANEWKKPVLPLDHVLPIKDLKVHMNTFLSSCDDFPSPNGWGLFLPKILALARDHHKPCTSEDLKWTSSLKFTWNILGHVVNACLKYDINGIFVHGQELVGLGEGLTPSGDDFMGGLLFFIRTLQDVYKSFHPSLSTQLESFPEKLKFKTNLISYTILKDHAEGHATETLHAFINTLFTGQDPEVLDQLALELIQMGHSSGWDLLTGVITGMLLIVG
jgi:hypothetical protein